jgi:hypothetical protein
MKFNWGYKILVVYLLFVAGILYMVIQASRQQVDLVTPDYYAQELKYQEKIDQSQRAADLSERVKFEIAGERVNLQFPPEFRDRKISGHILLYYPADVKKDVHADFSTTNAQSYLSLPVRNPGMHVLQVNWEADGVTYYIEEPIFIE